MGYAAVVEENVLVFLSLLAVVFRLGVALSCDDDCCFYSPYFRNEVAVAYSSSFLFYYKKRLYCNGRSLCAPNIPRRWIAASPHSLLNAKRKTMAHSQLIRSER